MSGLVMKRQATKTGRSFVYYSDSFEVRHRRPHTQRGPPSSVYPESPTPIPTHNPFSIPRNTPLHPVAFRRISVDPLLTSSRNVMLRVCLSYFVCMLYKYKCLLTTQNFKSTTEKVCGIWMENRTICKLSGARPKAGYPPRLTGHRFAMNRKYFTVLQNNANSEQH